VRSIEVPIARSSGITLSMNAASPRTMIASSPVFARGTSPDTGASIGDLARRVDHVHGEAARKRLEAIGQPTLPTPMKPTLGRSAISRRLSRCRLP
jgi:hypothetical protein